MRFAKKATLTLAGLLLLFALAFGIAACGAAEEEEPDEVAATEDTMEAEDESMAAEETMDETDESMTSEDTMDETDESMAETTEDTTFEAVEDDTGVYIAKPVVGEIFITSRFRDQRGQYLQGSRSVRVDGRPAQQGQHSQAAWYRLSVLGQRQARHANGAPAPDGRHPRAIPC